MSKAIITNEYNGWDSCSEEILVQSKVECDHDELKTIFSDLFVHCGSYRIDYDYDGKYINIKYGVHQPQGQPPLLIHHEWLDNCINNMQKWDKKKLIRNEIK